MAPVTCQTQDFIVVTDQRAATIDSHLQKRLTSPLRCIGWFSACPAKWVDRRLRVLLARR